MSIGAQKDDKDRPAYVRFEFRPVEDREASLKSGHFVTRDAEYVIITPAGSKDEVEKLVPEWLTQMKQQVREGRLKPEWENNYVRAYEHWKRGEEIPVNGTPIKGWPVLSPAQQKNAISANVRTVEDLAAANGEALQRLGMGAVEMKQKAEAWLKAASSLGTVVQENSALKVKVRDLETQVKNLLERNQALAQQVAEGTKKQPQEA